MQIAITADVHLTEPAQNPERYQALKNIFKTLLNSGVKHLIIAGDLFDASRQNYAAFEELCQQPAYSDLQLHIIPGNHDSTLQRTHFVAPNVHVMTEPTPFSFAENTKRFLFVPYEKGKTMGEAIEPLSAELPANEWILVGHGDWSDGLHTGNLYEPGVYMPLSRTDVDRYQPSHVFLGHIHVPNTHPPIYYMGSPCGLNITETGQRRFLLYDLHADKVNSRRIAAPVLYFDESLVIVPVDDEIGFIRRQIERRIASWRLEAGDEEKVQVRVRVRGYSADKNALAAGIREAYARFTFYNNVEPDLSEVSISDNLELATIAEQVRTKIEHLNWPSAPDEPTTDNILLDALHVIYRS